MILAVNLSWRSRCCRDQVGCVIVTEDNRVNSASYNGPPPGYTYDTYQEDADGEIQRVPAVIGSDEDCSHWCPRAMKPSMEKALDYSDCYSNHAEQNALVRADFTAITDGTIYVSSTPCVSCARNMAASGVARVLFRVDPRRPRDPKAARWFLEAGGVEALIVEDA
jgi:dCMP deaminase